MVECDEAALRVGEFGVARSGEFGWPSGSLLNRLNQLVTALHHPASCLFRRVPPLGIGFFSSINDVGDVAKRLDDLQGRLAAISGIGAKMLAASNGWRLTLDHDDSQHMVELRDVMPTGPGHDETMGSFTKEK